MDSKTPTCANCRFYLDWGSFMLTETHRRQQHDIGHCGSTHPASLASQGHARFSDTCPAFEPRVAGPARLPV